MRHAMLVNLFFILLLVGNVFDFFSHTEDWTPSVPTIIVSSIVIISLYVYMYKTPDRNVVPLKKVKDLIPSEEYSKLIKRGPR